jgi:hypothetical protein
MSAAGRYRRAQAFLLYCQWLPMSSAAGSGPASGFVGCHSFVQAVTAAQLAPAARASQGVPVTQRPATQMHACSLLGTSWARRGPLSSREPQSDPRSALPRKAACLAACAAAFLRRRTGLPSLAARRRARRACTARELNQGENGGVQGGWPADATHCEQPLGDSPGSLREGLGVPSSGPSPNPTQQQSPEAARQSTSLGFQALHMLQRYVPL